MHPNPSASSVQRRVRRHARNSDAYAWFNVLTGPEMFDQVESLLPRHRERLFPPTETLSMFLAQALNADRSCQNAVNQAAVRRALGCGARSPAVALARASGTAGGRHHGGAARHGGQSGRVSATAQPEGRPRVPIVSAGGRGMPGQRSAARCGERPLSGQGRR